MLTIDNVRKVKSRHPERHTQSCEISHTNVPWQDVEDAEEGDDGRDNEFGVVDGGHVDMNVDPKILSEEGDFRPAKERDETEGTGDH